MSTVERIIYAFPDPVYAAKAEEVFAALGMEGRPVAAGETGQTVGYLAGLPGAAEVARGVVAPYLSEPIMILCNISRARMDALFAALRAAGLNPADRKAVLTLTNASWTLDALYNELGEEHALMHGKRS